MGSPNYLYLCQSLSRAWTDTVKAETKEEKPEQFRCTKLVDWLRVCLLKTYKICHFIQVSYAQKTLVHLLASMSATNYQS